MNNDEITNTTNKTNWIKKKKIVFSDSSNNINENFQIMNMKQRVLNAFKAKKAKALYQENYKNIELLENIYEPSNNDDLSQNPVIENFNDSEHDGIDKPDPKRSKSKVGNPLLNFFDDLFERIDKFNYKQAKLIATILSNKTNSGNDILLIKYYIALFETIGFSYFACYNWFYFMFYCEVTSNENSDTLITQKGGGILSTMGEGAKYIKNSATSVGSAVKQGATSVGSAVKQGATSVGSGVSNGFGSVKDGIKGTYSNAKDNIAEKMNTLHKYFAWNGCDRPYQPEFSKRKQTELSKTVTLLDMYTIFL